MPGLRRSKNSPWSTLLIFIFLFAFTSIACQLGSVLEATPTPRSSNRDNDDDDEEEEPTPEESEDEEEVEPSPTPEADEPTPEPEILEDEPALVSMDRLQAATVQILAQQTLNGRLQTVWTGSGTILSPDGVILTNAHVAAPSAPGLATLYNDPELLFSEEPEQLVVALLKTADRPPIDAYVAEVLAADGPLDLAVIKITTDLDGNPVSDLNLPFIELGDSDTIQLGDEIRVLGYPGAGGETITFTRGNVSGFESQDIVGNRAWIKTDTTVSPGNSGGLGVNEAGQIIGIPSFVQEAMGGAINRLRAINYALPLLDAVAAGDDYASPYVVTGTGSEEFVYVTWADDFYEDTQCAINEVENYPSNTTAAVSIFSYDDMSDGEQVLVTWWLDDELLSTQVFNWDQGSAGDCTAFYIHNFGDPIPDGNYAVELYAGGDLEFVGFAETAVGVAGATSTGTTPSTSSDGVGLEGVIVDADTGNPIAGAVVFMLVPGADLDAWLDNPVEDDVYGFAETDSDGFFSFDVLFERGQTYPGVAGKTGYINNEGFLEFTADSPDVIFLELELSK